MCLYIKLYLHCCEIASYAGRCDKNKITTEVTTCSNHCLCRNKLLKSINVKFCSECQVTLSIPESMAIVDSILLDKFGIIDCFDSKGSKNKYSNVLLH